MHHSSEILLTLFFLYLAAQVGAEVAQRLKFPAVVGEIIMGCVIGPSALHWIEISAPLEVLSELGSVILLFAVGMHTRLEDLIVVGRLAITVGILGIIFPFLGGYAWGLSLGLDMPQSMFIAAAFVATSAGITAAVLKELKVLDSKESRVILGAAVVDDILAMLLLGVVTSMQSGSGVNLGALALVILQAFGFIALILWVGTRTIRKKSDALEKPINPLSPLTLSLLGCLGLAYLSTKMGLAAIIGAFLAGMVMAESKQRISIEKQLESIVVLMVPFFFVITGAKVELNQLASWSTVGMVLVVTILATLTKLIGAGLGAYSLGRQGALIVGLGMVPRGEVGIIVASLGLSAGVFSNQLYAIVIAMSLLTAIIAPPALKLVLAREK